MIVASHAVVYAEDAQAARAFLRDILELPNVDVNDGWLIFKLPPAEVGVHPAGETGPVSGAHQLFFICDDIVTTVAELAAKGVQFASPIENQGFGRITTMKVPGAGILGLYEPRHETAYDLD
ncbi:MAG: VOC family protein [Actinobacteria bacterium]|nr:VOC family protein [Actinomycetota bacterium]